MLLGFYVACIAYLLLVATESPAAADVGRLLVLGAVPFTGVALMWIALREWRQARVARVDTGPAM